MTPDEASAETEITLADEPEVREALATSDRSAVQAVVAEHPSSPLAWAELADLADSEGRAIEAYAFAAASVEFARAQLAAAGWTEGDPVRWAEEPNRAYLRALDAQRRAALSLGLGDRAEALAAQLEAADSEAPARIASEFTPTQLITVIPATPPAGED
ncbi:DUF3151 family protein [Agromyces mediolanus]|uniref:DUF3151 domain-containing protein n=1 Tax=Agromyces mediolanus TaxID=41986 RepID=A0A918CDQ4_AGRME|nr:DUF3151 family protein [Agromyces mediolanus]GGR20063.1 hypothetical protein GCM10010196_11630 [Agromyces mediolanus]GLJ73166.1 hypothetical protein GCM10017583_24240 [Agromyces mediolanus]